MPAFQGYIPYAKTFRHPLLQNPQNLHGSSPPTTEELNALHDELSAIKNRTKDRLTKATQDLEQLRSKWTPAPRDRERPKEPPEKLRDKFPKLARVKRETSEESPSVDDFQTPDSRSRHTSTSMRKSDADRKKKRKRDDKRGSIDPDIEMLDGTSRLSPSPALPPPPERPQKKLKQTNHSHPAQLTIPPPPPGPPVDPDVATDFNLPPPPVFTLRPTLGLWGKGGLLPPTPRHAYEVIDDFTNTKAPPQQTQIFQFWKEAESWMKPVGEEDVAWLRYSLDDTELFNMPKLERHYSEVWEEQEQLLLAAQQSIFPSDAQNGSSFATNGLAALNDALSPKKNLAGSGSSPVDILTDNDLATQKKSLGPFTERILSALLAEPGTSVELPPQPAEDTAPTSTGPPNQGSSVVPTPVSFYDLETRLRLELKACGLLGAEEPDFAESYDDDVASSLRELQQKLRRVKQINDARKERLSAIARDRLAYADYLELLEDLNRQITAGHQRILRANQKLTAATKKKKHPGSEKDKEKSAAAAEAAAEVARLKTLVLEVPESLVKLVEIRRQFKDAIGKAMQDWEDRQPGRLMGAPLKSIYDGVKLPDGTEWEEDDIPDAEASTLSNSTSVEPIAHV